MILLPERTSEFEMQAELFFALKKAGFSVRGEVPAFNQGKKSIFDLVVFSGDSAEIIIEVKNTPHLALLHGKQTKQAKKYKAYGLAVIYHTSLHSVAETVEKVKKYFSGY